MIKLWHVLICLCLWSNFFSAIPIEELIEEGLPQDDASCIVIPITADEPSDEINCNNTAPVTQEKNYLDLATQVQPSQALNANQTITGNTSTTIVSFPGTITNPGIYVLVQNSTVPANSTGLTIAASNVILDLNGLTITGATNSVDGISLITGITNVTIRNGTIRSMGRDGIRIVPTQNGRVNRYISLQNIHIIECKNNGLTIGAGSNFTIADCLFNNNTNIGVSIGVGNSTTSQNFVITNCISSINGGNGVQINNANNYFIDTLLTFNNGQSSNIGGNGLIITTGNRVRIESCQSYNNILSGIACSGSNNIFLNCQASNNTLDGFNISGNYNSLAQCSALSNSSRGFAIAGTAATVQGCEAKNNASSPPSGTTAAGFNIAGNYHTIVQNTAESNAGSGILLTSSSTRCQVRENTLINNTTGINNGGTASPDTNANRIYANYANNNTTNYANVPNTATSPVPADAINFTTNIAN